MSRRGRRARHLERRQPDRRRQVRRQRLGRQQALRPLHASRRRSALGCDRGYTTWRELRRHDRDGGTVYFTTVDPVSGDADTSDDLYRARIGSGPAEVARVSGGSGSTGDTDACTPAAGWNDVDGASDCSVLMVSGAGGIAEQGGSALFLSPELLDGGSHGVAGEPNLYAVAADGSPEFVATLAITDPLVLHAREDAAGRVTPQISRSRRRVASLYLRRGARSRITRPTGIRRSTATTRSAAADLRLLRHPPAHGRKAMRHCPPRVARSATRARSSSRPGPAQPTRPQRQDRHLRVDPARGEACLDRHQRIRLGPSLSQSRRQGRLLLHPRRPLLRRRKRESGEDLRRASGRRLLRSPDAAAVPGVR